MMFHNQNRESFSSYDHLCHVILSEAKNLRAESVVCQRRRFFASLSMTCEHDRF